MLASVQTVLDMRVCSVAGAQEACPAAIRAGRIFRFLAFLPMICFDMHVQDGFGDDAG